MGNSTEIYVKRREKSGGFPAPLSGFLKVKYSSSLCCGKHFWSLLPPPAFLCSSAWSPIRGKEKTLRNICGRRATANDAQQEEMPTRSEWSLSPAVRAAGLPALQWMETLLGELPALPDRGRAEVPAGSRATAAPGCRALGGCAGAVPRWDSGGTALPPAPSRGNTRRGCAPSLGWAGHSGSAPFPFTLPVLAVLC